MEREFRKFVTKELFYAKKLLILLDKYGETLFRFGCCNFVENLWFNKIIDSNAKIDLEDFISKTMREFGDWNKWYPYFFQPSNIEARKKALKKIIKVLSKTLSTNKQKKEITKNEKSV